MTPLEKAHAALAAKRAAGETSERIAPRRLDLRELYDELACEAVERWSAGEPLDAELSTIEALERARGLTVPGAWLGDRGARC